MKLTGADLGGLAFNKAKAESDGREYYIDEAEEKDLKKLIENSCMVCGRPLSRSEVKIVPPLYMQEKDKYVMEGIVSRRVMCVACYNSITSSTREKVKTKDRVIRRHKAGGIGTKGAEIAVIKG